MLKLLPATSEAIRYSCLRFHYARSVPSVQVGYSVFEDEEWCGTICFGGGAIFRIAEPFGLGQGEVLELVRVALNGKQKKTSQVVARAIKLLKLDRPLVKMLVSYADSEQGHLGTIYKATNWLFIGEVKGLTLEIDGKNIHPRSANAKYAGKIEYRDL